ncbi:MAG: LamG domain-containing protein, partial [Zoogloeaceae bacterium]|nr:LamG domain-containing protein [Zoogloeaceae bacterium]
GQALVLWYRRYEDFNNLTLAFYPRSSSAQLLTGTSDLVGAGWTHVALTRQADVWRIWVNGVKEAEATFAFDITVSNYRWYVGGTPLGYGQYPWTGQMDEVRISLGLARYSQNFTPPDKPFSLKPLAQGEFLQELSPTLHAPILYIDGFGRWAATPGNQTAPPAMYNAVSESGIGSFVAVPDGQYLTYWLCFTTCKRYPVKWIMGRRAHAYVELAQEENFKRLGLPTPEIVAAYRVVFRADATAPDALVVVEAKRIGRASQIDDYALTGQPERTAGDDWSLYSLRRTMWPEQVHTDATGVWVKLGGDITGFEEAYPLDLFPSLANVTAGDVVVTPNNMTAANAPLPYVVTQSSTVSASTYPGWKVFDGGTGQWRSNTSTFSVASGGDEWVQIDLGAAYGIGYLRFETPDEAHAPLRFQLWGSNNDAAVPTWYDGATLLAEVDSVYQLESLGTRIYGLAISNGSPFRFFRFRVQSLRTNTSTQCYLAEIKLLAAGLSLKNTEDAIGSFQFMKVAEAA